METQTADADADADADAGAEARKAEAESRKAEAEAETRKAEIQLEMRKAEIEAETRMAEIEAETRRVESEAEATKAKHDSVRVVAEKEKIEIKLRFNQGTPSRLTVRAVIKYDGLGLKTKLSNKMHEFGLLGCVARVPREDGSGEYDTDFTFEGSKSNIDKMKNFLKEKGYETSFPEVADLDYRSIKILKTIVNHRKGSSGSEAEVIYEATSTQDSSVNSRATSIQREFRAALLLRDGHKCVFCGESRNLEAAHIFPLKRKKDLPPPESIGIRHLNAPNNGFILCHECHRHFDRGLWWIDLISDGYKAQVSDALRGEEKYKNLHQTLLKLDANDQDAPLAQALKVQHEFCKRMKVARLEKVSLKPFSCEICCSASTMYSSQTGLDAHRKKDNCRPPQTKAFFTPRKNYEGYIDEDDGSGTDDD